MARNTKMIEVGPAEFLLCKGCAEKYEDLVLKAMLKSMSEKQSRITGLSPEFLLNLRQEQEAIRKEDEALIDDEVDIMDVAKAKRIFRNNKDPFEQRKPPLQIMREAYMKGMRKQQQAKIIVPGSRMAKPGKLILPKNFGRER